MGVSVQHPMFVHATATPKAQHVRHAMQVGKVRTAPYPSVLPDVLTGHANCLANAIATLDGLARCAPSAQLGGALQIRDATLVC